jgi:hypothetical protein
VGTLLTFRPRPEEAAAKTEAILSKIGQLYQQKVKAKEDLPGVLAQLVQAGEKEIVLQAVSLWGSAEMEAHEVLALVEQYAAAAGIKLVGNRPF